MSRQASRSRRIVRVAVLVPVVAIAGLVVFDWIKQPPRPDYAPVFRPTALDLRPAPAGQPGCAGQVRRWLVVGWDGAGWEQLLPLLDADRLPHLAGLLERGAHGNLSGFRPSLSPALWTTVATGRSPRDHGIVAFDKRRHRVLRRWERMIRLGKRKRELFTNMDRRVRALWNLLDEAGRSSLIVGYHNTFPAEPIHGAMVSNWLIQADIARQKRATAAPSTGVWRSLVHPPELRSEMLDLERDIRSGWTEALDGFVDFTCGDETSLTERRERWLEQSATLGEEDERWPYFVRRAWLFDTFHGEAALRLMERFDTDLTMVHFQSVDWAMHQFLFFHQPERFPETQWETGTAARLEAFRPLYEHTVTRFFEHLDGYLGRLIDAAGPETSVLVLSDHGFEPHDDPWSSGQHNDAPPGFWVAAGPGIRRATRIEGGTLQDILPTLAATLQLPLSRELEGRVLEAALCATRVTWVDDYEREPRFRPAVTPPGELTDELERQLESLGYLR